MYKSCPCPATINCTCADAFPHPLMPQITATTSAGHNAAARSIDEIIGGASPEQLEVGGVHFNCYWNHDDARRAVYIFPATGTTPTVIQWSQTQAVDEEADSDTVTVTKETHESTREIMLKSMTSSKGRMFWLVSPGSFTVTIGANPGKKHKVHVVSKTTVTYTFQVT